MLPASPEGPAPGAAPSTRPAPPLRPAGSLTGTQSCTSVYLGVSAPASLGQGAGLYPCHAVAVAVHCPLASGVSRGKSGDGARGPCE